MDIEKTPRPGEAPYLPTENIHPYQHGLVIEVMAASATVRHGGLSPKPVDDAELLRGLDARPMPESRTEPTELALGAQLFTPDIRVRRPTSVSPLRHEPI